MRELADRLQLRHHSVVEPVNRAHTRTSCDEHHTLRTRERYESN
jgi:hypothetical protein